jgi:hypothetical protein
MGDHPFEPHLAQKFVGMAVLARPALPGRASIRCAHRAPTTWEFQLRRSGYAAAFSDPQVIEAIRAGPTGRIAVTFIEWSGPLSQQIVVDWTLISNDRTAHQFGDRVVEAPRAFADSTSISAGIAFAMMQLDRAPYETQRRVMDVSGDGDNNGGGPVTAARDNAIAKGVTINGLAILTKPSSPSYSNHTNPPGGLANYYHDNVIGGPSAFVMVAEDSNSFGSVLIKKLTAELAQIRSRKPIRYVTALFRLGAPFSCGSSRAHARLDRPNVASQRMPSAAQ